AGHSGDLAHGVEKLDRDLDALLGLPGRRRLFETVDERVGYVQPGNLLPHEAGPPGRARDANRGDDEDLVGQAEVADHRHEAGEERHVKDQLRLNKVGPGPDFLLQPEGTELQWGREGVLDSADEKRWRLVERSAAQVGATVAHAGRNLDQLHRVDVIDAPGLGVIADSHIITTHQGDVADAERRGTEQVGLQRQPAPVANGELHDGL